MTRLRHSWTGFCRYMQVSNRRFFGFVEGKDSDRYFYGRLCECVCTKLNVSYEIVIADQLSVAGSGGKQILLDFFRYVRRINFLNNEFQGKVTTALFFVDKDIDDIERKLLRSDHVVYTEHYQVENYLFIYGNLIDSAAAAAGLDRNLVLARLGDLSTWRRSRAQLWSEWVKICVFVKSRRVRGTANYGITSPLNDPPLSDTNQALFMHMLGDIETASGFSARTFLNAFRRTSAFVNNLFARGEHDRIFKGKWYGVLIDSELRQVAAGLPYDNQHVAHRLLTALAVTLDYEGSWADHFKRQIGQLLA
jgi:hypothetical protein